MPGMKKLQRYYLLFLTAKDEKGRKKVYTKEPTKHETKAEAITHGERIRARHDWAGYIIRRVNINEKGRPIESKRRPYEMPSHLEEEAGATPGPMIGEGLENFESQEPEEFRADEESQEAGPILAEANAGPDDLDELIERLYKERGEK